MKIETGVVTTKGQLVIPARLRRRFGIKKGTRVTFVEDAGRIIVQPVTREFIRGLRGSLKGEPSPLAELREEHKRERTLVSALHTARYFQDRKARADFKAFDKIMRRRRGKPPREGDEMPVETKPGGGLPGRSAAKRRNP